MDIQDVHHLAVLSRLDIPEEEQQALLGDLTAILGYIDQITQAPVEIPEDSAPVHHNVYRADVVSSESDAGTAALLAEAPATQDGFIKVKKIL